MFQRPGLRTEAVHLRYPESCNILPEAGPEQWTSNRLCEVCLDVDVRPRVLVWKLPGAQR